MINGFIYTRSHTEEIIPHAGTVQSRLGEGGGGGITSSLIQNNYFPHVRARSSMWSTKGCIGMTGYQSINNL